MDLLSISFLWTRTHTHTRVAPAHQKIEPAKITFMCHVSLKKCKYRRSAPSRRCSIVSAAIRGAHDGGYGKMHCIQQWTVSTVSRTSWRSHCDCQRPNAKEKLRVLHRTLCQLAYDSFDTWNICGHIYYGATQWHSVQRRCQIDQKKNKKPNDHRFSI